MVFVVIVITNNFTEIFFLIFKSHGIESYCKGVVIFFFFARLPIKVFLLIKVALTSFASLSVAEKISQQFAQQLFLQLL